MSKQKTPKHILAIEVGHSTTKAAKANPVNDLLIHFQSISGRVTGQTLGLGDIEEDVPYFDWDGGRYVIGEAALQPYVSLIERHDGRNRYGNALHRRFIDYAAAMLNVTSGPVDLTVFAPPSLYSYAKKNMQAHINTGSIQLKSDEKARNWDYINVNVLPECIAGALCFAMDNEGNPVDANEILANNVLFVDIGGNTLDTMITTNGNFSIENLEHATLENAGVRTAILKPLASSIREAGGGLVGVTEDHVDAALRHALMTGDWNLYWGDGTVVPIGDAVQKLANAYGDWIANILDNNFDSLKEIRRVVCFGGITDLITPRLQNQFSDKVMQFDDFEHTEDIHPVDANIMGGLRAAKRRQKAQN